MQQRRGSHSVYALQVHIVFSTKYRYEVLRGEVQERCRDLIRQACDALGVRILKGAVSDMVRRVRGRSARRLLQEDPTLKKRYWDGRFGGIGYGAWSTGKVTDETVQEYLEHHRYPGGPSGTESFILE